MHRIDTQHAAALPHCVTRADTDQVIQRRLLRVNWTVLGVALAGLSSGCAVRHALINRVDDAVAATGEVYASDPDVELVGAATPFGLKLIESLLADSPQHRGLLLAASRGFTQYAYAYVEIPADELEEHDVAGAYKGRERARNLYLRARDYGVRGLSVGDAGFSAGLRESPRATLSVLRPKDVPLLYWTAVSWGAAISLSKDDAAMLGGLPAVQQLADRALELDEAYDAGAIHVLEMTLVISAPRPQAERIALAKHHFDRAVELSHGQQAAPFVSYAEAVSINTGQRVEFEELLDRALAIDAAATPAWRLSNEIFQRRARWLRSHADEFFSQ
ncbi:MAG: TRAP transporter TatT component family protein [Steroidobacteraceae bacterium]